AMSALTRASALAASLALAACDRDPSATVTEPKRAEPDAVELTEQGMANAQVSWQRVAPGTFHPRIRLLGAIAGDPSHVAPVGARAAGRVSAVRVALGDHVRRG